MCKSLDDRVEEGTDPKIPLSPKESSRIICSQRTPESVFSSGRGNRRWHLKTPPHQAAEKYDDSFRRRQQRACRNEVCRNLEAVIQRQISNRAGFRSNVAAGMLQLRNWVRSFRRPLPANLIGSSDIFRSQHYGPLSQRPFLALLWFGIEVVVRTLRYSAISSSSCPPTSKPDAS